jgi:hypothetical protein
MPRFLACVKIEPQAKSQSTFNHQRLGDFSMKKAMKIGLAVLAVGTCAFGTFKIQAQTTSTHSAALSSLQGKSWAEKCVQLHPEVLWLADAQVRKTEEGHATAEAPYSEQIFGQKFMEFDRTLMTIHCLKLILDGSEKAYQEFTAAQPKESKLSWESFLSIHRQGQQLLKSNWNGLSATQMTEVLETGLVLGDIGKSEKAREFFKSYGIGAPDHDDYHEELMSVLAKHPELCTSFARLPKAGKELLLKTANLAHFGHITHLEGGPSMFTKLKESEIAFHDPIALAVALFEQTCDVAGAGGAVNKNSSIVYTEQTHKAMTAMAESVKVLANPKATEWDAYSYYSTVRASWAGLPPEDRVGAKTCAMMRLVTLEEGLLIKSSLSQLDPSDRDLVERYFDVKRKVLLGRTPTYIPAVLVNLMNNPALGSTRDDRLKKALILGLPFTAKVLEKHQEMIISDQIDAKVPLNFNKVAGVAKSAPDLLTKGSFSIDQDGNVLISK